MLKLAFDRKNRVLQVSVSGIFASEDMDELDGLDRTGGTDRALERKWW